MGNQQKPHRPGAHKLGRKYGENSIRYFPRCLWCGREFPAKRPDAVTCKTAHRVALNRYVKKHGGPPLFPWGHVRVEKPATEQREK